MTRIGGVGRAQGADDAPEVEVASTAAAGAVSEDSAEPAAAFVLLNRRTGRFAEVFASYGDM